MANYIISTTLKIFKFLIPFSLITIFLSFTDSFAEDTSYQDELIQKAKELNLASDPQWIAMLHYKVDTFGYLSVSMADPGSIFFNSEDGYKNPENELTETIKKFFIKEQRPEGAQSEPYQCAFKARYTWLKEKLNFDSEKLPEAECKIFNEWFNAINPEGLSLIFPSTYINNPASAFGHTLLRIDQPNQTERTRLLAYTAHYSALTGGENALFYALKGIFGGYPGFFSVAPYYEKVKKYSDLEKRDIWEYKLDFSKKEIDFMVMHIWELRNVPFSYYYFDENCSYHLLSLLDVARPSLNLMNSSGFWVLPIDTVRQIKDKDDIIKESVFRPSLLSKINYRLSNMSPPQRKVTKEIAKSGTTAANNEFEKLTPDEKGEAVDLAYEYLNYKIVSGKFEYQKSAFNLLKERSTLPQGKQNDVPPLYDSPEQSHKTARAGFGIGRENGKWHYDLRYRGVYHDLMDPKKGFYDGAQIEMADTVFRQTEEDNLRLRKLDIVDIISLSPRNELIKPVSWNVKFGFDTYRLADNHDHLLFQLEGGGGLSWRLSDSIFTYTLLNVSNKISDELGDNYAVGLKPKFGIYHDLTENIRLNLNASYANYFAGDNHNDTVLGAEQRITLTDDLALRVEYKHEKSFSHRDNEFGASLDFYF